jgi:putative addiction module component (TIGR02574 family)
MTNAVKSILSQAASLSEAERAELAQALFNSLGGVDNETDAEFEAELDRRLDDVLSGKDKGVPAEEFLAELREEFK